MTINKNRYIYPAIFDYAEDGISIEFPDLPGCITCGSNNEEAISMAKEALALHLYGMEQDNESIPQPSAVQNIQLSSNQTIVLIDVWMPPFRDEMNYKAIKKTLTIPKWLDDIAKDNRVNYSLVLKEALIDYLGIDEKRSK